DVAIVTWPSFLVACVATMICFAFIDPVLVGNDDYPPPAFASRMSGYAIGFFFFWLISALSSLLTLYLARPARPDQRRPRTRPRTAGCTQPARRSIRARSVAASSGCA